MGAPLPTAPADLTPEWLSDALGGSVTAVEHEQIGVGVGLLGRLYRLTLAGDGVPSTVIAKIPTLDEGARMNVVVPMRFYEKEVAFYRSVSTETPLGSPAVHFAEFDRSTGDFLLLLEDLGSMRIADQTVGCTVEDAATIIDALADHHARWWGSSTLEPLDWLPLYADPPFPQVIGGMFKNAWPKFVDAFGDRLPDDVRAFGERFPDAFPTFAETGRIEPQTFIHGDLRLDQVFFGGPQRPLAVVDWQIAGRARGGYDVAYLLSQSMAPDVRRSCEADLIERYRRRLASHGCSYDADELMLDYRRTVAHCFCYPVIATGTIELANDRARALVATMLEGSLAAIADHDAIATWPE